MDLEPHNMFTDLYPAIVTILISINFLIRTLNPKPYVIGLFVLLLVASLLFFLSPRTGAVLLLILIVTGSFVLFLLASLP